MDEAKQSNDQVAAAGPNPYRGSESERHLKTETQKAKTDEHGGILSDQYLGLALRLSKGQATSAGLWLARTAALLIGTPRQGIEPKALSPADADYSAAIEATDWGSAHRALSPVRVAGAPMVWTRPASRLGSVPAAWGA